MAHFRSWVKWPIRGSKANYRLARAGNVEPDYELNGPARRYRERPHHQVQFVSRRHDLHAVGKEVFRY